MMEARLFEQGTVPEYTTVGWYAGRKRAPHLEQPEHRGRLRESAYLCRVAIDRYGLRSVSDMGCGDGGLLSLLVHAGVCCWGYDLSPENVQAARTERGVDVRFADFTVDDVQWGELTACTEVLEHLVDPHAFIARVPSRAIVASSPWRENPACHYEFHTWCWDEAGYRTMFDQAGLTIVAHERHGAFQILLAVREATP